MAGEPLTCRDTTWLVSDARERALTSEEREALKAHVDKARIAVGPASSSRCYSGSSKPILEGTSDQPMRRARTHVLAITGPVLLGEGEPEAPRTCRWKCPFKAGVPHRVQQPAGLTEVNVTTSIVWQKHQPT